MGQIIGKNSHLSLTESAGDSASKAGGGGISRAAIL